MLANVSTAVSFQADVKAVLVIFSTADTALGRATDDKAMEHISPTRGGQPQDSLKSYESSRTLYFTKKQMEYVQMTSIVALKRTVGFELFRQ
ncbi:hypothetical protein KIN20_020329 [Parelaphostrongylus tenuis]|uniref:Uncharacterized protein n=1 Tax=Parelaphostrongylus tenuis TaxID=148309 RepID=A0AAD5N5T1_PARTN|nr:hypothetical protein KIN20_020329 [Parelaphostrongylus tenuis]